MQLSAFHISQWRNLDLQRAVKPEASRTFQCGSREQRGQACDAFCCFPVRAHLAWPASRIPQPQLTAGRGEQLLSETSKSHAEIQVRGRNKDNSVLTVSNRKKLARDNGVCVCESQQTRVLVISSEMVTGCCHSSCRRVLLGGLTHREQVGTEPRAPELPCGGPKKRKGGCVAEGRGLLSASAITSSSKLLRHHKGVTSQCRVAPQ